MPGVKENGFTLWSFEDAVRIREHIQFMFSGAAKERNEKKRKEMLTFIVAGSGFTGIEMAGELLEWKSRLVSEYNIDKKEIKLLVVEAMSTILNMLDREQADKAEKYMEKHGVELLKNSPIVEVTPKSIKLKEGEEVPTRTLIWTCGIQGNQEASEYGLERGRAGRLVANEYMQAVGKENVFVAGDITYHEEQSGKGTPQIVEAALQTGDTIVKNIIASIEEKEMTKFKSNYHGFMVSIGGRYCVANLSGMKLSGFFAMIMKHFVNLHYLWRVNNINACFHYLMHEFFNIEDKRSIMRGHLSSKSNRLWMLPLRLFIGCIWVLEGLKKFYGENTWVQNGFSSIVKGIGSDSWIKSGNMKMPGFYKVIMQIMIPNADIAIWFQRMVVFMEICIGLALLAGLFTFLASVASEFLVVNFVISAMGEWSILWHFFGAIALMGGAGRIFGLDYWVMPWISDRISNWWLGKRTPIYKQTLSVTQLRSQKNI